MPGSVQLLSYCRQLTKITRGALLQTPLLSSESLNSICHLPPPLVLSISLSVSSLHTFSLSPSSFSLSGSLFYFILLLPFPSPALLPLFSLPSAILPSLFLQPSLLLRNFIPHFPSAKTYIYSSLSSVALQFKLPGFPEVCLLMPANYLGLQIWR